MKRITQRLLSSVALGLMVVVAGLLGLAPAGATQSVLDQSQPAQNTSGIIGSGGWEGEVFTAGQSGYLNRVSLYLGQHLSSTGGATVVIETVTSDGLPSGTTIGNGRISFDEIPATGGWVNIDITGAFVKAGTQYALLFFTGREDTVLWYAATGDVKPYPAGYWVSQAGGAWQKILTNQDWAFKTYVAPETLDQNQSQTSGGGGTRALGTTPVGQTLTVGVYGLLDRVSVYLTNSSTTPAPITVTILKVATNGLPVSGTQVATATIPAAAIPQPYARSWASVGITPLIVKPGEKYAILLSTTGSGVQWVVILSDVYPGGSQVIRNGTSWVATSYDFAFQTYVLTPILDQAQTAYNHAGWLGSGYQLAQSFTAHVTGLLTQVRVALASSDCLPCEPPSADITVGISWAPSDPPLGSGTIPLNPLSDYDFPIWRDASISGMYVMAGNQYALTLDEPSNGHLAWWYQDGDVYPGGYELSNDGSGWVSRPGNDMAFQTYVLPVPQSVMTSPHGITPCSNGVCPAASGGFNPADLTEGVKSTFQFQERPNGTVHGILNFNDPRPDGITLRGCTTQSAACALTVTKLGCTSTQSMTIGGTFTPRGGTTTNYQLTLSEPPSGPGTFSLTAGDYTYTTTLNGVVKVTCPPPATVGGP